MTPNSIGLCIVYENLWSVPFAVAARKAGGQLVAHGHIPTQALVAALDALDAWAKDPVMPGLLRGVGRTGPVGVRAAAVRRTATSSGH